MRILIDTDVLLDVALNRKPFIEHSAGVLRWAELGGEACIAWHSVANCAYLLENEGREFLTGLLSLVDVAEVSTREAREALQLPMRDLEDALQAVSARRWGAQYIVTRNLRHYQKAPIRAIDPSAFIELSQNGSQPDRG